MRVAIVGLGLIGGSIGLDLRRTRFAAQVFGVDANPEHATQALRLGLVDTVATLNEAIKQSDLVIIASPVHTIVKLLPQILDEVDANATVTDVGSTKSSIAAAVAGHPKRAQYVAGHPMAGTEHSGPDAALLDLFRGKAAVICDSELSGEENKTLVEKLFLTLGMRLTYMNSDEHDLHVAYVSHLSHITSFVLGNTVLDKEKDVEAIFNLASGGFESTVRLAKSSPETWAPIFEQNQKYVVEALTAYIERLQKFRATLIDQKFDETRKLMRDANEIKRVLVTLGGPLNYAKKIN